MVWKAVTLVHTLAVLAVFAGECDPAFGSNEAASSTSDFVGQVEAPQVDSGVNTSASYNTTALFTTSQLATSTDASATSTVTQEDTTQQSAVVTTASTVSSNTTETSESATQVQTATTSSTAGSTTPLAGTASSSSALTVDTTSKTASLLPNWVGTVDPSDDACYRKTYISSTCSVGYAYDNIATCWAQCPLNYPVQCGMECMPQNDDCTLEIIGKIESVATVALNAATSGVFGQLSTASAAVQQGVKCGQKLFTVVDDIVAYAEELQTSP
ncbi:unnamed protein product [Phytophthora lilii]|uniref:Unnamed protein product n=1 Tax=Phytophthora lilii TaxID=2077276 RepID=A0A9W6U0C8_9STRA|nr:unnamed protein product [Phytophthora lilii]